MIKETRSKKEKKRSEEIKETATRQQVQRRPAELSKFSAGPQKVEGLPKRAGEVAANLQFAEVNNRAAELVDKAVAGWLLSKPEAALLKEVNRGWKTSDVLIFDGVDKVIGQTEDGLRTNGLYRPTREIVRGIGGPDQLAEIMGGIAAELPLPIDKPATAIKRGIRVFGIVAGLATGHHIWAITSFKSLVTDMLIDKAHEKIESAIERYLSPREEPAHAAFAAEGKPVDLLLYWTEEQILRLPMRRSIPGWPRMLHATKSANKFQYYVVREALPTLALPDEDNAFVIVRSSQRSMPPA